MLCQVVGCGWVHVAADMTGSQDAHRCLRQLVGGRIDVDLGREDAADDRFHLQVRVSQHGSMRVFQVAVTDCRAIEVVEAWAAHFEDGAGSRVGKTAAACREMHLVTAQQRHWQSLGDMPAGVVAIELEPQHRQVDAAREVAIRCLSVHSTTLASSLLSVLQDWRSISC
jgi:hypothetical protein